jgi:hypothetical protein
MSFLNEDDADQWWLLITVWVIIVFAFCIGLFIYG